MCGRRRDSTLDANEAPAEAEADGVRSSRGCSCSDEIVTSRPKWRSDASRSLLNWETSSCDAAAGQQSRQSGFQDCAPVIPDCIAGCGAVLCSAESLGAREAQRQRPRHKTHRTVPARTDVGFETHLPHQAGGGPSHVSVPARNPKSAMAHLLSSKQATNKSSSSVGISVTYFVSVLVSLCHPNPRFS